MHKLKIFIQLPSQIGYYTRKATDSRYDELILVIQATRDEQSEVD